MPHMKCSGRLEAIAPMAPSYPSELLLLRSCSKFIIPGTNLNARAFLCIYTNKALAVLGVLLGRFVCLWGAQGPWLGRLRGFLSGLGYFG